jgi:methyl-accepting chemotaxis protein
MTHWTIGKRITFAIGLLCSLLFIVGAVTWQNLRTIRQHAVLLKGDVMPGMIHSGEFYSRLAKGFIRLQLYTYAPPAARAELKKEIDSLATEADETTQAYEKTITQAEDRALFAKLASAQTTYRAARKGYFDLLDAGKDKEAGDLMTTTLFPDYRAYAATAEELLKYNAKNGDSLTFAIDADSSRTNTVILGISGIALVLGAVVGLFIIRSTNRVLGTVADQLNAGAEQTGAAAGQVASSSQSLAQGSSEQAASLEETSASLEEISGMTRRNAESAGQAKQLSNETRQAAETGVSHMAEMKTAMDAIKESSASIAKIVKTIDEIAFQTNILALNAAVEAARAGEAGAGFAVVAEEVRSLAQRSAQSAKETATKIEDSVNRSEYGAQISAKVAQSFDEIVEKARKVDELVAEIATASNEQNQGIGQVTTAVSQMDKITQANAAGAEEAASASEELNAQAEMVRESVRHLQTLVGAAAQSSSARTSSLQPAATPSTASQKSARTSSRAKPALAQSKPAAEPAPSGITHNTAAAGDFFN